MFRISDLEFQIIEILRPEHGSGLRMTNNCKRGDMICPKCTAIIKNDLQSCSNCGKEFEKHPTPIQAADPNENSNFKDQNKSQPVFSKKFIRIGIFILGILALAGIGVGGYYYYRHLVYQKLSKPISLEVQPTWSRTVRASRNISSQLFTLIDEVKQENIFVFAGFAKKLNSENANLKQDLEKIKSAKAPSDSAKNKKTRQAKVQKNIQEAMISFYENYSSYITDLEQVINDPLGTSDESLDNLVGLGEKSQKSQYEFIKISGAITGKCPEKIFEQGKDIKSLLVWLRKNKTLQSKIIVEDEKSARIAVLAFATAWIARGYNSASIYMTDALKADPRIVEWKESPEQAASSTKFDITKTERVSSTQYKFQATETLDTGEKINGYFVVVKVLGNWLVDQIS